jgi:protein TonB
MAGANTQQGAAINDVYDDALHGSVQLDVLSGGQNRRWSSWLQFIKGTAPAKQGPVRKFISEVALNAGLLLAAVLATVLIIGSVGMLHETTTTVKEEVTSDLYMLLPKREPPPPQLQEEDPFMEEPEKIYESKTRQLPDMERTPPKFDFDYAPVGVNANISGLTIGIRTWDLSPPKSEYGMGEVDQVPIATLQMPPDYPFTAKRQGTEGVVSIRFLVTKEGEVSSFSVLKATPEGIFEEAARRSVLRWKFRPGLKNGGAVNTWVEMDIEFELG